MATYYAAVDMGASSGRLILGHMENGKMELEEIHRFENGMVKKDGELCWEFDRIFTEIVAGLKKCMQIFYFEQRHYFSTSDLGSSTSRSASPITLMQMTATDRKMAGNSQRHQ